MLFVTILLMTNLASTTNACLGPPCGDCYEWNGEACDWVGCDPACGDCEACRADCSGCDPICVDPVAEFEVTGYTDEEDIVVVVGTSLTFDASDSSDPDGTTLHYGWDFGDGGNASGVNVSHTFNQGGVWTVELLVLDSDNTECDEDCPDHYDTATRTIRVLGVDLEAIAAGNTPDLVYGRMCFNAQDDYKKAKWKAIVKGGGTAAVSSTGTVSVSFSGEEDSDTSALNDGDKFWVNSPSATGTYEITITHNDLAACTATDDEKVFEFDFGWGREFDNDSSGSTGGSGTAFIDETAKTVRTTALEDSTPGMNEGAWISIGYELEVMTQPEISGMYDGNVRARAKVTLTTDGTMRLTNGLCPVDWKGLAISINFGIVTVTIPLGGGGASPYGSALAGADCSIKMSTEAEVQGGDVDRDYMDVGFPVFDLLEIEEYDIDMSQLLNDITRTYAMGESIDMWCKVAVGSCLSDLVWDNDLFPGTPFLISPRVNKNEQTISSMEVEEYDGVYEICE